MSPQKESYSLPPIKSIHVYASDVVVNRYGRGGNHSAGKRGTVKEFTLAARKRLAFVAANTQVQFTGMITLTYPKDYPDNGKLVKSHRKRFIQWLTKEEMPGTSYLWFIEFQRRGAPHFHILFTERVGASRSWRELQWDISKKWNSIVAPNDADHFRVGTRTERLRTPEGGKHYAVKYSMKMRQKLVPAAYENVGRFYGYSRDVRPNPILETPINWQGLRKLLAEWPYLPDNESEMYKVLFNTSGAIAPKIVQDAIPIIDGL